MHFHDYQHQRFVIRKTVSKQGPVPVKLINPSLIKVGLAHKQELRVTSVWI